MAEFKHLVRIANTDLKGEQAVVASLQKIKGIGQSFAAAICHASGVNRGKKTGELSEAETKRINEVVLHPNDAGIPIWMLNRQKDYETGQDKHILLGDIKFTLEQDKRREMRLKSYKGLRYQAGLPVRGQRTRSNFRPNKGKVTLKKRVTVVRK